MTGRWSAPPWRCPSGSSTGSWPTSSPDAELASTARSDLGRLVQTYLDHLSIERGVSRHTLQAYGRDLRRYLSHLAERGVSEPGQVTPALVAEHAMRLRE